MFRTLHGKLSAVLLCLLVLTALLSVPMTLYTSERYRQEASQKLNRTLAAHLVSHLDLRVEDHALLDLGLRPAADPRVIAQKVFADEVGDQVGGEGPVQLLVGLLAVALAGEQGQRDVQQGGEQEQAEQDRRQPAVEGPEHPPHPLPAVATTSPPSVNL